MIETLFPGLAGFVVELAQLLTCAIGLLDVMGVLMTVGGLCSVFIRRFEALSVIL